MYLCNKRCINSNLWPIMDSSLDKEPQRCSSAIEQDQGNDKEASCEQESSENINEDLHEQTPVLSKRKQKRLVKHQRWLEMKEKRKIEKKEKKRKAKEQGLSFPSRSARRKKQKTMDSSEALPLKIAIDMAFDEFMNENAIRKLLKQVKWCYSVNRKARNPVQLYLTSFGGQNKTIMEEVYHEYMSWDIHIKTEQYLDVFEKSDIVYLSSESENVLEDIDVSKIYIIGGLVDHNHHKGLCHKLALEKQVNHAHLPIKDFVRLQSRTVLTVNHVFEILLKFLETKNWQSALHAVIPKRKGVSFLDQDCGESDESNDHKV